MHPRKGNVGSYGWFSIAAFVFIWDLLAYVFSFELLTDAWKRWLTHPRARWLVGVSWLLTTKHLFFGKYVPWLDPFHIIAMSFRVFDRYRRINGELQECGDPSSTNLSTGVRGAAPSGVG